jgi:hypothetical protein
MCVTFICRPPPIAAVVFHKHKRHTNEYTKMKKSIHNFQPVLAASIAILGMAFAAQAANLSDKDKQFLVGYEKVHTALAADDLPGAKAAAADLGESGSEIAKANSLKDARVAFEKLSGQAKRIVAGQSGYYVVHCPMLKKDWVQTSTTVANPYGGKGMISCGEIEK